MIRNPPASAVPGLDRARDAIRSVRTRLVAAVPVSLGVSAAGVLVLRRIDPAFLSNPVLLAVLALFGAGQLLLLFQLWRLWRRLSILRNLVEVLEATGREFEPAALRSRLAHLPPDPARDLLLDWLDTPGCAGAAREGLLRNASNRGTESDIASLGWHALLNRSVLKVGFVGTLVGLLLTFPPMKRAILGLSGSDGEMSFIRDIARAIDEDAYAIQATLVATAFSLLMEAFVVQVLERLQAGLVEFGIRLDDWRILVLESAMEKAARSAAAPEAGCGSGGSPEGRLERMEEVVRSSEQCLERLARLQEGIAGKLADLAEWEAQYRSFLRAKDDAARPRADRTGG